MNVVGRVGSLISQGVYSVATPFHPFGGAVDVIVVGQQDGTYRSTPWYVRFGKFQGVLKGAEKMVRIAVNGVEANFHMYLDNSGEAYFIREVCKDKDDDGRVEISGADGRGYRDESSGVGIDVSKSGEEEVRLEEEDGGEKIESSELEDESAEYSAYYERLDQVEDVEESQGSDSEVVLFSVDGHVLTAPISSGSEDTDNLQLCTPQFHLGPGEGADFSDDDDEELSLGQETGAAEFGDLEATVPIIASEEYRKAFGEVSESRKVDVDLSVRVQETCKVDSSENVAVERDRSPDALAYMDKEDVYKSCLELTNLHRHVEDSETHDNCSPSSVPSFEVNKYDGDLKYENSPTSSSHNFHSPRIETEAHESSVLTIENSGCLGSDTVSLHSVTNDVEWKDEHFDLAAEVQGLESSPGKSAPGQEGSTIQSAEPQTGSSDARIRSNAGMGFEISLCGNLLHAGMGLALASETFDAYRMSEEEFKASASSIVKEENLIVRFKGRYLPWGKASHIVLGMAAFGLDLLDDTKDAILVETPKLKEHTPELTSTPSGRRWRLWPIAFRRVKTLEHTTSTSSNEEVFVDSESGSQNPRTEPIPSPNAGNESPHKKLVRTNIPTTEEIASLNLKDGQNMITFSFSTRVLGTQQVDAHIYLWKWNARIVISDVDGTITKSDVLGQFMPLVGRDWTQSGVTRLFSAIKENGYQLLFLSARAIVQAYLTRSFLLNIKQDGKTLPNGPVVISPDGLFPSLYREVIRRAPHEFKIACLEDIKALFPSDYNPFYAGFGNRDTDELSYRKIGIPKGKIFIINPKGEVAISHRIGVKSYTSLHTLVNDMFPPTSMIEQEDFNSWNYWKTSLPPIDL